MADRYMELKQYALYLMQALLGVISPNFRCILLARRVEGFVVRIFLATHCDEDSEEIDDLMTEFEILFPGPVNLDLEVIVSQEPIILSPPNESTIPIFKRRE